MRIPVVFAVNNEYIKQLAVSIHSLLVNSMAEFDIYVLSSNFNETGREKIYSLVKNIKNESSVTFIDLKESIFTDLDKYLSHRDGYSYISKETYYRLYIQDIFKDLHKIIYLDADIIIKYDISELFKVNIDNVYAGVIQDAWQSYVVEQLDDKTDTRPNLKFSEYFKSIVGKTVSEYFNAGILLLNLDNIRKDNLREKYFRFLNEHHPLEFMDQDVLNYVFGDNIKFIDYKWNLIKDFEIILRNSQNKSLLRLLEKSKENPGIVHYIGPNKPWKSVYEEYPYFIDWWNCLFSTHLEDELDRINFKTVEEIQKFVQKKIYFELKIGKFKILSLYRNKMRYYLYLCNTCILRCKTSKYRGMQ